MKDVEAVYDEQIFPKMAEIIAICKKEGVPFAFQAQLKGGDDPMFCTTSVYDVEGADKAHFNKVVTAMKPPQPKRQFAGIAVMKGEDGAYRAEVTNSEGYSPDELKILCAKMVAEAEAKEKAH